MTNQPGADSTDGAHRSGVSHSRDKVTRLIDRAAGGDAQASSDLLPLVYDELRRVAEGMLRRERGPITLQPTALVHEAYLRLLGPQGLDSPKWENRRHFFGAAAIAMRRILIDRARHVKAARVTIESRNTDDSLPGFANTATPVPGGATAGGSPDEMLDLDAAMNTLRKRDDRQHEVVMLRFFAGLTIEQTAEVLDVSPATVKSDWSFARAWLMRELERAAAGRTTI